MSAPELIVATSVVNPEVQTPLLVTNHENIGMGREFKRIIYAEVLGHAALAGPNADPNAENMGTGRTVSLMERIHVMQPGMLGSSDIFVRNWHAYRAAGIPTVPTLRTSDNRGTLLVTDVKADGSEVYGKGMAQALSGRHDIGRYRANTQIDPLFLEITADKNWQVIVNKANEYTERAVDAGIVLAYDDAFEMIVHPDGTWDLIALDLLHAVAPGEETAGTRGQNRAALSRKYEAYFLAELDIARVRLERRASEARLKIGLMQN
jgi:hypothetical protein